MPVHIRLFLTLLLAFWLLTTLLVLRSGPAYAEWVQIGGSNTLTTYADPETIRRKGNLVKMWELYDYYKTMQSSAGNSYLSLKHQEEYDCAEEQNRTLAQYAFSNQMGNGDMVFFYSDPGKWAPVMPGSVGQTLWKIACGKK